MKKLNIIFRPILITLGLLLIPLVGNLSVDDWNWPWNAFVFFGLVLFGAILAYDLFGKKAKKGVIRGFVLGIFVGVLFVSILRHLNPEEDVAGIVIATLFISGLFFAFVGYLIQNYRKKKSKPRSI